MRVEPVRLAVFISGSGSNLQAIVDAISKEQLRAKVVLVVSNKPEAFGLKRAIQANIQTLILKYPLGKAQVGSLLSSLANVQIEAILLAGFLQKIPSGVIEMYQNRILNIHPALLPKFGGKGMYGHHVHEAIIAAGEKISGATVHLVTEDYDTGPIVAQESIPILSSDSAASLADRVLAIEHRLYPLAVQQFIEKEFQIAPTASTSH